MWLRNISDSETKYELYDGFGDSKLLCQLFSVKVSRAKSAGHIGPVRAKFACYVGWTTEAEEIYGYVKCC